MQGLQQANSMDGFIYNEVQNARYTFWRQNLIKLCDSRTYYNISDSILNRQISTMRNGEMKSQMG